ncbi:MAG: N-methylhydantoinase [Phycisphaerales bacterium]|nr:N-methylhydantoinase [Phycisphaerales bacterium]
MPTDAGEQTSSGRMLRIGVDVGGTFTDLVAFDAAAGTLAIVKIPSTPPDFHLAVIEATNRAAGDASSIELIHGSTVATNALLQRAGEAVAFITTEGFRDMLLIGRQNRPRLYALRIERPAPITPEENWFTVRERIDARGRVVTALSDAEIARVLREIQDKNLRHVAICLLFSFVNPSHEQKLRDRLAAAGLTISISSEVLPEFREYERASTTAINASLRPTVQSYLESLASGLPRRVRDLRITQSAGGTLSVEEASRSAAKLVLSGPAGGVMGAAFVARAAGFKDVITYDMGGTSTDVALVSDGQPHWTTRSTVDGLPIGLPVFDIHTVGAGGGSIAAIDAGGALRVGPKSAGAIPGPASYGRGGTVPTVTDANLVLRRIVPDMFLGGAMKIDAELAHKAIEPLAAAMGKSVIDAALGIVRVAEANMTNAVRAVTAQRGHDPRQFTLVSFGGAGGLHACALADGLEIKTVLVPPYAGVLSALGMVVAPPVVDVARTVVQMSQLTDGDIEAEFAKLSSDAEAQLPKSATASVEHFADVRFRGQSHELKIAVVAMTTADISRRFYTAYKTAYGRPPGGRAIEIVTLRVRHIGKSPHVALPPIAAEVPARAVIRECELIDAHGETVRAAVMTRSHLAWAGKSAGPFLLIDAEATTFVPAGWLAQAQANGSVVLNRLEKT